MLRLCGLRSLCLAAGAYALAAASFSPDANALLVLSLDDLGDGFAPTIVTDGDLLTDGDGLENGEVEFSGPISDFTTNFTAGVSKPSLLGTPTLIDLLSGNISSSAGGTIVIMLSDTGFTNPTSYLRSAIGGVTNGTVTYETFVNTTNGDPFAGTKLANETLVGGPFGVFGDQGCSMLTT